MSVPPITSAPTGLTPVSGAVLSAAEAVNAGARSVAARVISRIGDLFQAGAGGHGAAPEPAPYDLQNLADALGRPMSATPIEVVDIERALESLAGAVAADMVALADGRTLDRFEQALASFGGDQAPVTPGAVAHQIEQLAAHIAAAR